MSNPYNLGGTDPDFLQFSRAAYWNPQIIDKFLNFVLDGVEPARIAEFGSGLGYFTSFLTRKTSPATVTGFEINAQSAQIAAQARERETDLVTIEYVIADCRSAPVRSDSFDLVVSHFYLVDCPEPQSSLKEALRVLKPGGVLALMEPIYQIDLLNCYYPGVSAEEMEVLQGIYKKVMLAETKQRKLDRTIAPRLPQLCHELGLTDLEVEVATGYHLSLTLTADHMDRLQAIAKKTTEKNTAPGGAAARGVAANLNRTELELLVEIQERYRTMIAESPLTYRNSGFFTTMSCLFLKGRNR